MYRKILAILILLVGVIFGGVSLPPIGSQIVNSPTVGVIDSTEWIGVATNKGILNKIQASKLGGGASAYADSARLAVRSFTSDSSAKIIGQTQYGGILVGNLDTVTKSGAYSALSTAGGVPSNSTNWLVWHLNSNTGIMSAVQMASSTSGLAVYLRVKISGAWGSWTRQFVSGSDTLSKNPLIKGDTSGAAIPAGYVGEIIQTLPHIITAPDVITKVDSIALTKGWWYVQCSISNPGIKAAYLVISSTNGDITTCYDSMGCATLPYSDYAPGAVGLSVSKTIYASAATIYRAFTWVKPGPASLKITMQARRIR